MNKIIILIPYFCNGGTENQTIKNIESIIKKFNEVVIAIYFDYDKHMINRLKTIGVKVVCLNLNKNTSEYVVIKSIFRMIKELNPNIVHVQYMAPGALPIIAAKLAGVPRIFATVHQPWTPSHKLRNKYILRAAARLCERFTVVSQNAERSWFGFSNLIDSSKSIDAQPRHLTIYNAVDVDQLQQIRNTFYTKLDLSTLGIPQNSIVIGLVSRLRHEKGVDVLVQAFADLPIDVKKPTHLVLVGDGPDRQQLMDQAKKLGVQDRVHFLGALPWEASMRWMAQMDIVVVPSRFEGFGLTAAEAMAMSKPVVVSDTFGLTELIEDGISGLVFNNGDSSHLTKQLRLILNDSDMEARLAVNALERVRSRFDLATYKRNIATLYGIEDP